MPFTKKFKSFNNINNINIANLPKLKPFYDKMINKKVPSDYYVAIPYGKKYLAWFTFYNRENVCIFIEVKPNYDKFAINERQTRIMPVSFHNDLSLNTILYGTFIGNKNIFCTENIYYYKNKDISQQSNNKKFKIMEHIFKNEINQSRIIPNNIVFGLPLMNTSYKQLCEDLSKIPYQIYCIQLKYFHKFQSFKMLYKREEQQEKQFKIMADSQTDIYKLYLLDELEENGDNKFFDYAYIPNLEISKLLNNLFRNIKENTNLDLIEESDDEEDFENVDVNKYVDLEKSIIMNCEYNSKFKRWVPISEYSKNTILSF